MNERYRRIQIGGEIQEETDWRRDTGGESLQERYRRRQIGGVIHEVTD